jgi:hypothetical protein
LCLDDTRPLNGATDVGSILGAAEDCDVLSGRKISCAILNRLMQMQKSKSVEKSGYEIGCHERGIIIRSQKCLLFLAVQEHIVAIAPRRFSPSAANPRKVSI